MARLIQSLIVRTAAGQVDKFQTYMMHCNRYLADANEASDAGKSAKAERLYEKSQYWLDKANAWQER